MQLLVSVRHVDECRAAMAGGADIIDIKEPAHGALGRADHDVIRAIVATVKQHQQQQANQSQPYLPVSAALGELVDQTDRFPSDIPLDFVKIGLANAPRDWRAQLTGHPRLIPTAYADHASIPPTTSPPPPTPTPTVDEIIDYAITHRAAGILIDTAIKNGQTLLDHATPGQLNAWINRAHADGLFIALAGSLRSELVQQVATLRPDIIAVRGAACTNHDRQSAIDAQRVAELKQIIAAATPATHHHAN